MLHMRQRRFRGLAVACCLALFFGVAMSVMGSPARLDVLKVEESFSDKEGLSVVIRIGVTGDSNFAGNTVVELRYPGQINQWQHSDGSDRRDQFVNKSGSMVGFNLRSGVQINDIHLVAVEGEKIVVIDDACGQFSRQLKEAGREVRGSELYLEAMGEKDFTVAHHNAGSDKGWFRFKARIVDGKVKVIVGTVKDW